MKTLLLVKYNKVTDDAFRKFAEYSSACCVPVDLRIFGNQLDTQSYLSISRFLSEVQLQFDAVMVGDIFWPTGQHICHWCKQSNIPCYFLQHGQWIYVDNKKNPKHLPTATFVLGHNVERECLSWNYGKLSKVIATGTPRYDKATVSPNGTGIYFGPPVIHEQIPSSSDKYSRTTYRQLEALASADLPQLMLHPHYREGELSKLREWFPDAHFIHPMSDPLKWIQKASLVLTHRNSTTVLDAIACGKKSILMNFDKYPSYYREGYFGRFAVETHSPQECADELCSEERLDCKNYHRDAADYIVLGSASERIDRILHNRSV